MAKTAMEIVKAARSESHISGHEIRHVLFPDFFELHGDGASGDDPAIVGGIATFHGEPVTIITTSRGHSLDERMQKHFGQPSPCGYRKVVRLAKQAAKFHRPILFFIDTAGAYPGKDAEENGQGQAIAQDLLQVGQLATPIISVLYGEGGSGGALALACGDEVWMLENSMYSILSPEGFASIMWKDANRADEAAEVMKLTPADLLARKVIEGIIAEPENHEQVLTNIDQRLQKELQSLEKMSDKDLLARRYQRFRKF
ncbi:acetyl-CoA carboxylase carboxyltransferase subunit alpha [Lactobacillus ultunensis]|uniref:acetyl-CoA carboxytransferase n=1 Tax=Lactobacillus ultunensis DSM 16047 TaxID=525365 RepID=C2EKV4_9LACO|nr:carboxyltransferase subunit alpha [Lactobacillus ultunensis]EEJ72811.1 Acetyl co-enzyme A carboxylase carboxyltransferase alpha subunit [Lactobacillus ultunensis DSM 16047]KRL83126.1 acetyl-CoA carboxylase [Lactobacillus ultunensis DSM 16047]QQP29192.1 acetyl-CoA carboxylase carboxyl transferase subunit alpha [Lactobacillus ultunensis]